MRGFSLGLGFSRRGVGGSGGGGLSAYAVGTDDPKTVADFVAEYYRTGGSDTTFASMFTVARASDATYVDANGVLQTATSGNARVGHHRYNGSSWVDKGLLLETEARTNIIIDSEDASQWVIDNTDSITVTVGDHIDLNKLEITDTTNETHFIGDPVTALVDIFSAQCVVKKGTHRYVAFGMSMSSGRYCMIVYDLETGTITQESQSNSPITEAGIEPFGTDTYVLWLIHNPGKVSLAHYGIQPVSGPTPTFNAFGKEAFAGTAGAYFHAGRLQVEQADTPSSYIPTAGAEATRAAETLTIAGADMAASTAAMSFQMDGEITYADEGAAAQQTFFRWRTDANNFVNIDLDTDSTATGEVNANQAESGTVDTVVAGAEYTAGLNVAFNIASRNTSGAINVAKDGTAATEDSTPTALPDLSSTTFELGYDFMGTIAQFRQWDVDLGDSGIATAST